MLIFDFETAPQRQPQIYVAFIDVRFGSKADMCGATRDVRLCQ